MLEDPTPRAKNIVPEISDKHDVAFLKEVDLEEKSKVQTRKLKDQSIGTVKICLEGVYMDVFVCVEENETLLATGYWGGNA